MALTSQSAFRSSQSTLVQFVLRCRGKLLMVSTPARGGGGACISYTGRQPLSHLRLIEATAEHHTQVARMLDRSRGAKLTYVDASSLCLIEKHKIQKVWSTDHHLALTGAQILPRS